MKSLGSEILETSQIRLEEGLIFLEAAKENGSSLEEALLDMHFIDDIMTARKSFNTYGRRKDAIFTKTGLIRKGSFYLDMVNRRLDQLIEEHKELKSQNDVSDPI